MLGLKAKRAFTKTALWCINSVSAPLTQVPLSSSGLQDFEKSLTTPLLPLFLSLCSCYDKKDSLILRENLEPSLSRLLSSQLSNTQVSFKKQNPIDVTCSLFNFNLQIGAHINRSLNFKKAEYAFIGTSDDIKKTYSVNDQIAYKSGSRKVWEDQLNRLCIYVNPDAPANLVISVDAEFKGMNPLVVVQGGKDLYGGQRVEERHWLRFESEVLKVSNQGEAIISGELDSMLRIFIERAEELLDKNWVITDIDGALNGNPYTIE